MTAALAAMLGQICLPGGGFGIANGADPSIGTMTRPMPWPSLPQGENQVMYYIPVAIVTEMLKRPGGTYEYNGEQRIFPDIRIVLWAGCNPFYYHQDLNRLRRPGKNQTQSLSLTCSGQQQLATQTSSCRMRARKSAMILVAERRIMH